MVKIAVIGAGINGLASAVKIKEYYKDAEVVIISNEFTPNTTGDGSGGLWNPYLCGDTPEKSLLKWGSATYKLYHKLWLEGGYNICFLPIYDFYNNNVDIPSRATWADGVFGYRTLNEKQLEYFGRLYNKEFKSGIMYSSFVAHSSSILKYFTERFKSANGKFLRANVTSLRDPVFREFDIVVNCSGLGARKIVPDDAVFPIRGQISKVLAPWVNEVLLFDDSGHYIIPNPNNVVLGGTHQEHNYSTKINDADTKYITDGCTNIMQGLKNAQLVQQWAGLRPGRYGGVRLEAEQQDGKLIIHNYGHGGSGLTLFWGCAEDVLEILKEKLPVIKKSKL